MAEYIRLRMTAAKAGVTMALLALIGGLAERSRAATPARAQQSSALNFLKLRGLSHTISSDFLTVEKKLVKLNSAVSSVEKKLVKFERSTSSTFLKITDANAKFLKITDANAKFLTVTDANAKFLKADGTAVNAAKLNGLTPDAFFQGKGNVVSGALNSLSGQSQQLLSLPGGIIVVSVATIPGAGPQITIHNGTSNDLIGVGELGNGQSTSVALKANGDTQLPAVQSTAEIRLQIFPGGSFTDVVSILIGLNQGEAVAQAFTGGV
jgi:hypothetical protein